MKKILLILVAASSLAACKKSKVAPHGPLIGKWELHSRYGGNINPPDTTYYQPGNGNMLQFNADSTYKKYTDGTLSQSGIFHTRIYYSMSNIRTDLLYFDNDTTSRWAIRTGDLLNGKLNIGSFIPDVGEATYNKISN